VAGLLELQKAVPLGLQVNWSKTKIQHIGEQSLNQSTLQVAAENIDLVNDFVYNGSLISYNGVTKVEILRRIRIAKNCFTLLEKNIWSSRIRMVCLYKIYVLPVLPYGCET